MDKTKKDKEEAMSEDFIPDTKRWLRWLGQKAREPYWTELLNCQWMCWVQSVLDKWGTFKKPDRTQESVKAYYRKAIMYSSPADLARLDVLCVEEKLNRRGKK